MEIFNLIPDFAFTDCFSHYIHCQNSFPADFMIWFEVDQEILKHRFQNKKFTERRIL